MSKQLSLKSQKKFRFKKLNRLILLKLSSLLVVLTRKYLRLMYPLLTQVEKQEPLTQSQKTALMQWYPLEDKSRAKFLLLTETLEDLQISLKSMITLLQETKS